MSPEWSAEAASVFEATGRRARTYAERMFRHVVVDNLELDAAADALAIPLAMSGRSFGLSLIGQIVEQTAGYPYFLQFFGASLAAGSGSST